MARGDPVPAAVLVGELRAYLRIEGSEEDAMLAWLCQAATEAVEAWLGWCLIEREVAEMRAVTGGRLELAEAPVRGLLAVEPAGGSALEPLPPLDISRFGRGSVGMAGWPEGTAVAVRYRAGLAGDWNDLPDPVRLGVMRAAAHFFAHRDAALDGGVPPAVARLIQPWRARRLR